MDRIPDGSLPFYNPAAFENLKAETKKTKEKSGPGRTKKPVFSDILNNSAREVGVPQDYPVSDEALAELLDTVHGTGDDLKRRPFPEEIKRYRGAVKNFLYYVTKNGYAVEEQTGIKRYLNPNFSGSRRTPEAREPKRYTLVRVVDQKLEALALGLLRDQINQIELLARIDEIAGLLVDLLQ
ncbi:MAG: YaaR family protein [Spirochaetaceae bacterium]|jgi:uncharacterized protein YaaR (DUF327 family)|nr:YaaR family protein [Spirochaetaceae bacterium]